MSEGLAMLCMTLIFSSLCKECQQTVLKMPDAEKKFAAICKDCREGLIEAYKPSEMTQDAS